MRERRNTSYQETSNETNEEQCWRAEAAAEGVRESLAAFQVECIDIFTGEVMVSKAVEKVLEPIHH